MKRDTSNERENFFYLPSDKRTSGGMRQSYRHVEILRSLGREAYVTHASDGFRFSGSSDNVPVVDVSGISLTNEDVVVFPEILTRIPNIQGFESAATIINVQGAFLLLNGMDSVTDDLSFFYRHIASAIITNSRLGLDLLRWLFPEKPSYRFSYSFDKPPFVYGSEEKQRQYCYMPRKRSSEQTEVFSLLNLKGMPPEWKGVAIDGLSEKKVSEIMQQSVLFLSFSEKEGIPMPPCEAMSCGCVVIGYHGVGGAEYFGKDFCITVSEEDSIGYATKLYELMQRPQKELVALGKAGSNWVTREYSTEKEISSIRTAWDEIMENKINLTSKLRIKVIILHHNKPENADKLFCELSEAFDDVEIWDSGSSSGQIPIHVTKVFPNIYWTGAWNEVMRTCSDYDIVWVLGCDIELRDRPELYRDSLSSSFSFGCWSPCIDGRAHPFMLADNYQDGQPKSVKNVEGMALAASGLLLREIRELLDGSPIGFGQDYWMCYRARQAGMTNIIDGRVKVFHPEGIGYDEKLAHDQMEKAFTEKYGPDFRQKIFEYSSSFAGNLFSNHEKSKKEKRMLTVFTIDNGWGLADFEEVTRQFPEIRRVLMKKGVSSLNNVRGIDVIPYNSDLSQFNTEEYIGFFPRVGPANFEDFRSVVALGIPVVVNVAYHRELIVHEKNGFVYQEKGWAGKWLRSLITDSALRRGIRENSIEINKTRVSVAPKPAVVTQTVPVHPIVSVDVPKKEEHLPLVTVITPTFRREPKIVRRSCFSLQLQTVADWEQLVCSDGTDELPIRDLVTSLADPRIQYRHTTTKKACDFGNTVRSEMLKAARGKYVVFMDDDNVILPEYLEKMVKAVETSGADFAVCRVVHFGPLNELVVGKPPKVLTGFPVKLFHIDSLQVLVKREVMQAIGWDTERGYTSDGVTLEALGAKYKSVEVAEVLGFHL